MSRIRWVLLASLCFASLSWTVVRAQSVPGTINFQGRLTDNTLDQAPITATMPMAFGIWDSAIGGTRLWRGPDPTGPGCAGVTAMDVAVEKGIFNILLGATCWPIAIDDFGGATRYLEITLHPGAPTEEVLTPRLAISSVPFAQKAENAAVALGAADSAKLGGLFPSAYLLTTDTAADSAALGGVGPSGWQKALSPANCDAGEVLVGFSQSGTPTCEDKSGALAPLDLSLDGSAVPVLAVKALGSSTASAMTVSTTGSGSAGTFAVTNFTNVSPALSATTAAEGNAANFSSTNTGSSTPVLSASHAGVGAAGSFVTSNVANGAPVLAAVHYGIGNVANFAQYNPASNSSALYASTEGSGSGVFATTNGLGPAIHAAAGSALGKALMVSAAPGQIVNLTEWKDGGGVVVSGWDPLESTCRHASLSIL